MTLYTDSSFGTIYPKKLEELIRENHYIVRLLRKNEKLKLYHKYWNRFREELFKVTDTFTFEEDTYYVINFGDDNYVSIIPESDCNDMYYEILKDYYCISDVNIFNDDNYYTGAEIKYWFIIHNINFDDEKYEGFWKYFSPSNKYYLYDSKKYKVYWNPRYTKSNCEIIKERKPRG